MRHAFLFTIGYLLARGAAMGSPCWRRGLTGAGDKIMATVRISGNWRNPNKMEWGGAPEVDDEGRIERSFAMPEEAFLAIEQEIARGGHEGAVVLENGGRVNWFLDA